VARTFTKNTSNTFTTASGFFDNSTFGTGRASGSGPTAITYSIWARARGTYAATATALTDGLCGLGFSSTAHITLKTDASGNLGSSSRAYYFDSDQVGYTTYKLPTERWVHLVAIFHFASRRVRYFADGVFVGSTSASGWSLDRIDTFTNAGSLRIGQAGNQATTTSTQFAGDLAHFAVWNRQLTETEIQRISKGLDPRVFRPRVYYPLTSLNAGVVVANVVAPMCQGTIAGSLPVTDDPIAISANLQPYLLAIKAAAGGGITGSSSQTEPAETGTASGTVLVSGSSSQTEPSETGSASGTVLVSGSSDQAEPAETGTASGTVGSSGITGDSNQTEPAETGTASGTVLVSGNSSQAEPAETGSASGTVLVSGSSSQQEPAETGTASGTVGSTGITGNSDRTEPTETGSASGTVLVAGASSQTEPSETGTASGTILVTGSSNKTEPAETGTASGGVFVPNAYVRKRDERIIGPRYPSRQSASGMVWWVGMRDRRVLARFNGNTIDTELVLGARAGQIVFQDNEGVKTSGEVLI
jgi:hypothetical protein